MEEMSMSTPRLADVSRDDCDSANPVRGYQLPEVCSNVTHCLLKHVAMRFRGAYVEIFLRAAPAPLLTGNVCD